MKLVHAPVSPTYEAVLLAAGRSTRMGRDKALLPLNGGRQVLWERQWDLLGRLGCGRRWLSARPDQTWIPESLRAQVVEDEGPQAGPLSGVVAAWKRGEASHLIVLAVDLFQLPEVWFHRLQPVCRLGRGAVGQHGDGRFEPLAAIYPRTYLSSWEEALIAGRWSFQALLGLEAARGTLAVEPIAPGELSDFRNANRPEDFDAT